ncbi:high-potential iron-sulfur protein [Pleomorphovibrio marinus]|uniref:high-potential iron-sulfur protein n=1 Tax=Pleomorphovibrio marinus TaxID=2164132 RepID=UPI000E0CA61E|nr:high-potential iron-sulfur protein [Pleomorphovibrio marinus]
MNRRVTIKRLLNCFLALGSAKMLYACTGKDAEYDLANAEHCGDLEGLDEVEISKRKQLGYTEETPIEENICGNCQLYLPPKQDANCGGCQLFKGPVYEEAYCTYWAPRVSNA